MPRADFSTTPPPRRVPESLLRAEIAAFPLASEESFRAGMTMLDPMFGKDDAPCETNKTGKLWRSCETMLAAHTGWSLDRLLAARDRGWFGKGSDGRAMPMHQYLRTLILSHLSRRAGVTEIEESTELTALDAAEHFRWLVFSLPEDLLLAAIDIDPAPVRVEINPPLLLRRLLDLGVAEIHQHIGAGMDFPLLWASALAAIATTEVGEDALAKPGAPLSEGKCMVRWLLVAAIARCVLAEHLIRGNEDFHSFVHGSFLSSKNQAWTPRRRETLVAALGALIAGDDSLLPDIERLRDLYADIHPLALMLKDDPIASVEDAFRRCDPIAARLQLHGRNAGERWLIRNSLAYLDRRHKASMAGNADCAAGHDDYFASVFWQTTRVRCQYYRTVVQRPLTGGLQWFIRFYDLLGNLRNPLNPIMPQVSYDVAGEGHRIRALEFRTSLDASVIKIGEGLLGYLLSWRKILEENSGSALEPEMGVVFHFVKHRDEHAHLHGKPPAFWAGAYAEPEKAMDVAHGRYAEYFAKECGKARALAELIAAVPSCLWAVRGLDIATDELGVPTWVHAPLFRHVVDASAVASIRRQEDAGPPLNITAHVGEDFRHLLEGMRRIHENVQYILGGTRGRLGHAIALGLDPQTWAESVGSVLMPAEERLWDLVWEWRMYTRYRIRPEYAAQAPPGRVDALLNKAMELSDYIYGSHCLRMEELAETHHMLHRFLVPPYTDSPAVEGGYNAFRNAARNIKYGSNHGRVHSPRRIGSILETCLDDEYAFRRGQMLIDVPVRMDEVAALDALQLALRRGISRHGIVVEVNPSSNLLIGDLLDLRNHPILRLNPPVAEPGSQPPVAIALGSDDPLTFNTELLKEYALLHRAACSAGYPERAVQQWLEDIRRTGMDARFTHAWRPNARSKVQDLIDAMNEYLYMPPVAGRCNRR